MPSIVGPARYMRPRKLRTNADTPINRAVSEWQDRQQAGRRDKPKRPEAVPPPVFGPPVDMRSLPGPMQDRIEVLTAWVMGGAARRHLIAFLNLTGRPADEWVTLVELTGAWVEALFLVMAFDPAARKIPCLPGCRGEGADGRPCRNPRRFGCPLCPEHEAEEDGRGPVWAPRTESEARAAGLSIVRR